MSRSRKHTIEGRTPIPRIQACFLRRVAQQMRARACALRQAAWKVEEAAEKLEASI